MFKSIKSGYILGFLFLLIFAFDLPLLAYGVDPLNLDINAVPGEEVKFNIRLTPAGRQEIVNLELYQALQELSGGLRYIPGGESSNPALDWINFDSNRVVIPPDQHVDLIGTVRVPYEARGSYTVALMVEPEKREGEIGIVMQVRYAVRINIFVDGPGLRARAEVAEFDLGGDENMKPLLYTHIKNVSPVHLAAAAEVTVRTEDRRLLERVILKSPVAAAGADTLVIYSGSEVKFEGLITEPLPPGTYDLRLFLRYGQGQQVVKSKQITIGDEYYHPDRIQYVEVEPAGIEAEVRPGGAITETLQIRNRVSDHVLIQIGGQEIEPEYSHSIFADFDFQLRGESELELPGRRTDRQVMIIRAPREIIPAGYYGKIAVGVYDREGEFLESHLIPLDIMVTGYEDKNVKIEALNLHLEEETLLFSVTAENTGPVHIVPEGVLRFKQGNQIVRISNLSLQESVTRVLPRQGAFMVAEVGRENMDAGDYQVEVVIRDNGIILAENQFEITIPEKEVELNNE